MRENKEQKYIIPTAQRAYSNIRSILGPLLFNINMCDMFFEKCECDIASYDDDNTFHRYDSDLYTVLSKLKNCADSLFTWFKVNHMKPNGDKCHLLATTENVIKDGADGSIDIDEC